MINESCSYLLVYTFKEMANAIVYKCSVNQARGKIRIDLLSTPLISSYGRLFSDGGELAFRGIFSASGLFGIRSYMRLPSGAFGGLGNDTMSGFGIFSFGVKISHSPTTGPGLPKRSAMCVTLPRSFFLYTSK